MDVVPVVSSLLHPVDYGMKPLPALATLCACVCVATALRLRVIAYLFRRRIGLSRTSTPRDDRRHVTFDHFQRSHTDRQPKGSATAPSPDIAQFLPLLLHCSVISVKAQMNTKAHLLP